MPHSERMAAARVRSQEAYQRVVRKCERITEELEELTPPAMPIPIELHDEDSAVHVVESAIKANKIV